MEATVITEVTTAEIRDLISTFSVATMIEGAMYRLIVIADLSVVGRHIPAADMAAVTDINDNQHNAFDKNRPD